MSEQPSPTLNTNPSIHDLVVADLSEGQAELIELIKQRKQKGLDTYSTPLQAFNGRCAFQDAIEELADALVYVRQLIEEGKTDAQIQYCYQSTAYQLQLLLKVKEQRNDLATTILEVDPNKTIPYLNEG